MRGRGATAAPPEAPKVTLLRADRYVEFENPPQRGQNGRPCTWYLVVDDELQAWTDHHMTSGTALEWAERWLQVKRAVPVLRFHCLDDMDEGYWAVETPVSAWLPDEPVESEPPRRRWRRDRRRDDGAVEIPAPRPEPVPAPAPPAPVASRPREAWPRFLVERAPSWLEGIDYARRGAWSTSPPGAAARWWHVAWAHSVAAVILAVAALLGWSAVRPARFFTALVVVMSVATALNTIPGVDLLVPDALTFTTWWEALR